MELAFLPSKYKVSFLDTFQIVKNFLDCLYQLTLYFLSPWSYFSFLKESRLKCCLSGKLDWKEAEWSVKYLLNTSSEFLNSKNLNIILENSWKWNNKNYFLENSFFFFFWNRKMSIHSQILPRCNRLLVWVQPTHKNKFFPGASHCEAAVQSCQGARSPCVFFYCFKL